MKVRNPMEYPQPAPNEAICLQAGLRIDVDEGWRKLTARQFGGDPGRAFGELIQNLLDSYPSRTPWENRRGEIRTAGDCIAITDYGEGLDRNRLKLIATLGGTDKREDPEKIGQFGIGFFSIFNPRLETREVRVTTVCEGQAVRLDFLVRDPDRRPELKSTLLSEKLPFSTRIEVFFSRPDSVSQCLTHARNALAYYPCRVSIDGALPLSVWDQARGRENSIFAEGPCHGIFYPKSDWHDITLLCKYEKVLYCSLGYLITGGHAMSRDLRDYHLGEVPVLPDLAVIINCNALHLTISRDGFYLDSAFENMNKILARQLLKPLEALLKNNPQRQLVQANQFVLRRRIRDWLERKETGGGRVWARGQATAKALAEAKVFRIKDTRGLHSLEDLWGLKSAGVPLYFAPRQANLDWLGGAFKHDFIVLPDPVYTKNGAPDFYDALFGEIFEDVVNLDTVAGDSRKLKELAERGIISQDTLSRRCRFVEDRMLSEQERAFLKEIAALLGDPEIREVIARNILVPIRSVKLAFFALEGREGVVSTGLFDGETERPLEQPYSNWRDGEDFQEPESGREPRDLILGFHRDHPVIDYLLHSQDAYRVYYTLTYIAHELAACQRLLAPCSPFFHFTKERLAADMREALLNKLE